MWTVDCRNEADWLEHLKDGLRTVGFTIVTGVLDPETVAETERHLLSVAEKIEAHVGKDKLREAGELGVYRVMGKFDPYFFSLLENPAILQVVDATVSETAVLHLQNGFILPPFDKSEDTPKVFQNTMHMDFRRVVNRYPMSVNVLLAISPFTQENGGTLVVPGSHQMDPPPSPSYCARNAIAVECPAGSAIVFDSTLWHAAGSNISGQPRLAINHQFTRSYIKQQIDLPRALGKETILAQKPRTQQLLGWYTRVPTDHEEFYLSGENRLYKAGQG